MIQPRKGALHFALLSEIHQLSSWTVRSSSTVRTLSSISARRLLPLFWLQMRECWRWCWGPCAFFAKTNGSSLHR